MLMLFLFSNDALHEKNEKLNRKQTHTHTHIFDVMNKTEFLISLLILYEENQQRWFYLKKKHALDIKH